MKNAPPFIFYNTISARKCEPLSIFRRCEW
nr:MAG TPA: hypothetical protein [Bacteriophage sp.]